MSAEQLRDFRVDWYERQAAKIVDRLRSMADDVERAAKPYDRASVDGAGRFVDAAEQVNHAIAWGIANAGAYRLSRAAAEADASEREVLS